MGEVYADRCQAAIEASVVLTEVVKEAAVPLVRQLAVEAIAPLASSATRNTLWRMLKDADGDVAKELMAELAGATASPVGAATVWPTHPPGG